MSNNRYDRSSQYRQDEERSDKSERAIIFPVNATASEKVMLSGNLSDLTPDEQIQYYKEVCESVELNPITKPFEYVWLDGKLTLYAKRDCADQLRRKHNVSIKILDRELVEGVYAVRAQAKLPNGREDESIGAVPFIKEGGEWQTAQNGKRFWKGNGIFVTIPPADRANAVMKAETKSKRRVTLSICGLGMPDESELEDMNNIQFHDEPAQEQKSAADKKAEADPGLRIVPKAKSAPVVEVVAEEIKPAQTEDPKQDTQPEKAQANQVEDDDVPAATVDPPVETEEQKAERGLREHMLKVCGKHQGVELAHLSRFVGNYTGPMKNVAHVERCKQWSHALSVLEEDLHQHPSEVPQLIESPVEYAKFVRDRDFDK